MLKIYRTDEAQNIFEKRRSDMRSYEGAVREILDAVKADGDKALIAYIERFDGVTLSANQLRVTTEEIAHAYEDVEPEVIIALKEAAENIRTFHLKQKQHSWMEPEEDGKILGQIIRPLERAGIYVPGGTAAYPSSVLMNAIPAKVAGVKEIVMVTPPLKDGKVNSAALVAADIAGVTEIYRVGGAQGIGALAYGTDSIKKVDIITGPGNIYVTVAKKLVFGEVQIDMLAGPSEILIIADETADVAYLAADLLSQAEHDVLAASVLVTTSQQLAEKVIAETERQLELLPRKSIAERSLADFGAVFVTKSISEAIDIANQFAPEHLEIMTAEPFALLGSIKNAGAIFVGAYSPEPVGDYFAGPNHILPTGGSARFYSPLNVDTFMKKTSVIYYTQQALMEAGEKIIILAEKEGLHAHANAIAVRLNKGRDI